MVSKLEVPHAILGDISPYLGQDNNLGSLTIPHPKKVKSASLLMMRIIVLFYPRYFNLMLRGPMRNIPGYFPTRLGGRGLGGTGAVFPQQNGDDLFFQDQV
jgi:hypothetical protein